MKWFKPASVYIEKEEKNTAQQIKNLAKTYADSMCPDYIDGWSEKDKALFFAQRELIRTKKERDELKAVVNGESGYYGHFQEQFTKLRNQFESNQLHLELEKQAYQKLYMEKRELEAKVYTASRELEIRNLTKEQNDKSI